MKIFALKRFLPAPLNAALTILSAILLVLAFPGFEFWFLALFALVPLFFAVEREKESVIKSLVVGWTFGTGFFFGSCWWLTYAPITYAGFPVLLAYFLLFCGALAAGFFPAVFAALLSILLKRFGGYAILSAPFLWTAIEFLRFWTTGNNWNAIAYSQAINGLLIQWASVGGIYLVGFLLLFFNVLVFYILITKSREVRLFGVLPILFLALFLYLSPKSDNQSEKRNQAFIVVVQPNVPMSGLSYEKWQQLRRKHVELAENALQKLNDQTSSDQRQPTTVIFPESPMNFMYSEDLEFQKFVRNFASKNNVSVLFNAAEPDAENKRYFNSAVMVDASGKMVAQYDKIYLVPFGESVPAPLQNIMPALVGSFSYGKEYDLLPLGDAKAGVMICFESHFPNLSREYVRQGADVLVEMTNDGYLGKTPVLRQHLANAVFRAVETNRPVVRVTNVGITAYINERGEVLDAADSYTEATRVWTVAKSDGSQTFYVKYGDWFAWLCSLVSLTLLFLSFRKKKMNEA
ncbi:MAG TPA: apolipoprotein N-acyltransferase [Pyrinomonadaceae bacterium]|jgi:apolipoprotein N-acyltransferase